jgi:hypothetical protein
MITRDMKYMFLAGWQHVNFNPRKDLKILTTNKRYFLAGMWANFVIWIMMLLMLLWTVINVNDVIGTLIYVAFLMGQFKLYSIQIPKEYTWKGFN